MYWRNKGIVYIEMVRPWLLPILGGGAALKYLGLDPVTALLVMLAVGVASEALAVVLGWLEHRSGATEEHYRQAALTDPYKTESLRYQQQTVEALHRLCDQCHGLR